MMTIALTLTSVRGAVSIETIAPDAPKRRRDSSWSL
jgi:hypothetical protein